MEPRGLRPHLLTLVAAALLALTGCGGGDADRADGSSTPAGEQLPEAGAALEPLAGLPQSGLVLGELDAPVTIIEFLDFQCPYCREFHEDGFGRVVDEAVRPGRARLQIVPLAFLGPDSVRLQASFLHAAQRDRAFDFAALAYRFQGREHSGYATDAWLGRIASSIPNADPAWFSPAQDQVTRQFAQQFDRLAQATFSEGSGTPLFLVAPTSGSATRGDTVEARADESRADAILRAVDEAEAEAGSSGAASGSTA